MVLCRYVLWLALLSFIPTSPPCISDPSRLVFIRSYASVRINIPRCGDMLQAIEGVPCAPHVIAAAIWIKEHYSEAVVAAIVQCGRQLGHVELNKLLDASHLCHLRSCSAKGHVVGESRRDNLLRQGCLVSVQCDCGADVSCCPHEIRCLQPADHGAAQR
jgi:Zinc-binding loop region of homing endonuclease